MSFVANFIRFPAVQKVCKSVKIWQSYKQLKGGNFLRHSVVCNFCLSWTRYCIWQQNVVTWKTLAISLQMTVLVWLSKTLVLIWSIRCYQYILILAMAHTLFLQANYVVRNMEVDVIVCLHACLLSHYWLMVFSRKFHGLLVTIKPWFHVKTRNVGQCPTWWSPCRI